MPRPAAGAKETKTSPARKRAASSRSKAGAAERKAPTRVARRSPRSPLTKQYALSVLVAVIAISASVGIGVLDAGQIDVTAVIEERNAKVSAGETPTGEENTTSRVSVPVQNTNTAPNGGLRGAGDPPPPPPEPETGTSTATSSEDGTATSTDATATSSDATADESTTDAAVPEPEENTAAQPDAAN